MKVKDIGVKFFVIIQLFNVLTCDNLYDRRNLQNPYIYYFYSFYLYVHSLNCYLLFYFFSIWAPVLCDLWPKVQRRSCQSGQRLSIDLLVAGRNDQFLSDTILSSVHLLYSFFCHSILHSGKNKKQKWASTCKLLINAANTWPIRNVQHCRPLPQSSGIVGKQFPQSRDFLGGCITPEQNVNPGS